MTVTRTIKTRLAIEGEAEYQAKMRQCSDAIRETSSTLELVTAKYAENANSIEALTEKGDVLQKMYDQQAEKVKTAADALENARKAQEDYARDIINIKEKLADAEKQMQEFADAGVESGEAYEQLENSIKGLKNQLESSEALYDSASRGVTKWKTEVNKAEAALYKTGDALRKNNDALEEAREGAEGAGEAYKDMAEGFDLSEISVQGLLDKVKNISPTVAVATTAIVGATKAAYDFAETYQNTASVIGKATGAIGGDLNRLTDVAYRAAGKVSNTLEDVAAATAEINTRYGLVGDELEDLTVLFSQFARVNNTDIVGAVQSVSKVMRAYNIETESAGRVMDMLTAAAQKSGASIDYITDGLMEGKAQFQNFGFTLTETIAMMAMFEAEGLDFNKMIGGFETAVEEAAAAGKSLPRSFRDAMEAIEDTATEIDALNIATEYFGTEAAQEMVYAIKSGRFELDEWVDALENSDDVMLESAKATETFADKWQQLKNRIAEGVIEVKSLFQDLTEETADAMTTSEETLESATAAYDERSEKIEISSAVVSRYIERLHELEQQETLTAEQQAEYNNLVERINALMPELNLKINEQTGLIEGGTEALLKNVEAWKEFAKQQAELEYAEGIQKSYTDSYKELIRLSTEHEAALTRQAEAQAALDAEQEKWNQLIAEAGESTPFVMQEAEEALRPFRKELEKANEELEANEKAMETATETYEAAEDELDALTTSYESLGEAVGEAYGAIGDTGDLESAEAELENYANTLTTTAEQGIAALEQLQAEYDEAYNTAYASIDGQLGKWKEFATVTAEEAAAAVDALNSALDSQIQYLESYTENFNNLMSRDIDGIDVLAEKLSDGSEESAAILAGLTEKTDEEIEAIIEKLGEVEEGKEEFANQVALMETDYAERMQEIEDETGATMEELINKMNAAAEPAHAAGVNVGSSFNEGLRSMLAEARAIAAEFESVFSGMESNLDSAKSAAKSGAHSHATGLYSVPYDEYPAILHKGERVLTAAEARIYNDKEKYGNTDNSKTVNVGDIVVNDGGNSRKTARAVKRALREVLR